MGRNMKYKLAESTEETQTICSQCGYTDEYNIFFESLDDKKQRICQCCFNDRIEGKIIKIEE